MPNSKDAPKKAKKIVAPRTPMPEQPAAERRNNFKEVALGYTFENAIAEAKRCLACKKPKCVKGCPVEVPINQFVAALADARLEDAYNIIKSTNSLPAVCGRVCPQENQCEGQCILNAKDEPIAIGRLERFVADTHRADSACGRISDSPDKTCALVDGSIKVACIGGGPSSLTVAGYLASRGIKVDVFEALHEVGGVLVYGIPEFRLPKNIVASEIADLESLDVTFYTNWVGGKTVEVKELLGEMGYNAVYIGVGAGLPRFLNLEGESLIGVFSANEYLTRVNLGRAYEFPKYDTPSFGAKKVAVIGGGNVAMDAARTAVRLGAESVSIVYRRTQGEMPARLEELHHAIEEGVKLEILSSPVAFNGDERGFLKSMTLQRMELGEPDASGRRRPVAIDGEMAELECDMAVVAVGAGPNPVLLEATPELALNKWGYVSVDEETGETNVPNVFAGGDIVTGAATVISAMGAGRRAAKVIADRFLGSAEA